MPILGLAAVKAHLSELIEGVSTTQDHITITKNGQPAAVLVGADEWESLQETLCWLGQPGVFDDIAQAREDYAAGRYFVGSSQLRG